MSVRAAWRGDALVLTLERPGRGNALTVALLEELADALAAAPAPRALVLTGAGRAFSAGGDVAEIAARLGDAAALSAYCADLVGALNRALLALAALPCPVIARVNGPVTGGACGLVFLADLVAMTPDAFVQPYYGPMGFAPDGGWSVLLAERIGPARAMGLIARDARLSAGECERLGLADRVLQDLDAAVDGWLAAIAASDAETLAAARRLLRPQAARAALAERLEDERRAFLALVARPQAADRMRAFLTTTAA